MYSRLEIYFKLHSIGWKITSAFLPQKLKQWNTMQRLLATGRNRARARAASENLNMEIFK